MTSPQDAHVRKTLHGYNICSLNTQDDEPTWRANAALIAAAPELLEALRSMLASVEECNETAQNAIDNGEGLLSRARAAIAKAGGKS